MASLENIPIPTPESAPSNGGDKKEKEQGKRRRLPRAPLQIEAEAIHAQEAPAKKKRKRRSKKTTEAGGATKPESAEKTNKKSESAKSERPKPAPVAVEGSGAQPPEAADTNWRDAVTSKREGTKSAEQNANELELEAIVPHESEPTAAESGDIWHIPLDNEAAEAELFVSSRLSANTPETQSTEPGENEEDDPQTTPQRPVSTQAQSKPTSSPTPPVVVAPVPPNPNIIAQQPPAPLPPVPPRPPMPPFNPNIIPQGGHNVLPSAPVAAAANRLPNPRAEVQRDFNERRRTGQALVVGILIGGLVEHFRHKKREKRVEKEHSRQVKQLGKEHEATRYQLKETEQKNEETQRQQTALERQLEKFKQVIPSREQQPPAPQLKVPKYERPPATRTESLPQITALTPERPAALNPLAAPLPANPEAKPPQPELQPDEAPLEIPKDHRMESSAWHHIEVDNRTGKAAEAPAMVYGEEFKHEQHQEQLRQAVDEASMHSAEVRERYATPLGAAATDLAQHDKVKQSQHSASSQDQNQNSPTARIKQTLQHSEPVDVALWIGLGLVFIAIVIAL